MTRRILSLSTVLACAALALPGAALAGSLPAANSGTISVFVPGAKGAAPLQPAFGSPLGFSATGTEKLKNPLVWVACYQNGVRVYGAVASPSETVKLGGDSSQWVEDGGGAASCTAELYYILNAKKTAEWNGNGAQGGDVQLALTAFEAAP